MLEHVLPADVDNNGECRAGMRDICEILVGTDAQIYASGMRTLVQFVNDVQVRLLIQNEIVQIKVAFRFGPVADITLKLRRRYLNFNRRGRWNTLYGRDEKKGQRN